MSIQTLSRWLLALLTLSIWLMVSTISAFAVPLADGGQIYLPIVLGGSGASATSTPVTPTPVTPTPVTPTPVTPTPQPTPNGGPSSEAKIRGALQKGEIDRETALLYRVYAAFADPRLPSQFVGDDSQAAPSLALREAQARWQTLSPTLQTALAPFLLPPNAPGSWLELRAASEQVQAAATGRIIWEKVCTAETRFVVWYQARFPEDMEDAAKICAAVGGHLWRQLEALLGRTPKPDELEANNGGDKRLDIYVVSAKNQTVGNSGCDDTSAHLLYNHDTRGQAVLAQLLTAAFLYSYDTGDCAEYEWLFKATTTWAIDFLYPADQSEQSFADDFLNNTGLSLNTNLDLATEYNGEIDEYYGGHAAYLWLFHAVHEAADSVGVVRKIWEAAGNRNSLAAINSALGGDWFKRTWARFSTLNWNQELLTQYQQWDGLLAATLPQVDETVLLDGKIDGSYALDAEIDYLTARTYRFQIMAPTIRSVYFINPFHDGSWPTAEVNALVKIAGQPWAHEVWTGKYGKGYCLDLKAERLAELVIVISNHEFLDRTHRLKPAYPPRLNFTNVACRGWAVHSAMTSVTEGQGLHKTINADTKFTLQLNPWAGGVGNNPFYEAVDATVEWKVNHTHVNCKGQASGSYTHSHVAISWFFIDRYANDAQGKIYQPGDREYTGFVGSTMDWPYKLVCPNGTTQFYADGYWFNTGPEAVFQVKEDGTTITGKYIALDQRDDALTTTTWEWTMTALPPE